MKFIVTSMVFIFVAGNVNAAVTSTHFKVRLTVVDTCTSTNGKVTCIGGTATNTQQGYDAIRQETNGNLVTITY